MELFVIKYVRLNLRYLYLYHSIKNLNVKIDDVIHGNDISTYDQAHGSNGELKKLSTVITTYLQTEIIVLIRKMISK